MLLRLMVLSESVSFDMEGVYRSGCWTMLRYILANETRNKNKGASAERIRETHWSRYGSKVQLAKF